MSQKAKTATKKAASKSKAAENKQSVEKTADLAAEVVELCAASDLKVANELGSYQVREIETDTGKIRYCVTGPDVDTRNTDPKGNGRSVCEAIMGWAAILEHIGSEAGKLLFIRPVNLTGQFATRGLERASTDREIDETEKAMYDSLVEIAVEHEFMKTWRSTGKKLSLIERSSTKRGKKAAPKTSDEEKAAAAKILEELNKKK